MEFLSILGLFGCTLFFHNGFSPVFSVMKETRQSERQQKLPVYLFFGAKLVFDAFTGVLPLTVWQYPCFYVAWIVSEKSALASSTAFYILSNTICFMQMSPTALCSNLDWCVYSNDFAGWCACMLAGLPYYLNSLIATCMFSLLFKMIREWAGLRYHAYNFAH